MFDAMPLMHPPALIQLQGEPGLELVKRKKDRRAAAIVIGSILILGDGSECQVVGFDKAGQPLCAPIKE